MATFTASAAQPTVTPKGLRVGLQGQSVAFDNTLVSLSIGTVWNMVKVPANARVLYMTVGFTGIGDATFQVGDQLNGTRYRSVGTLSAGQGMVLCNAIHQYVYSADDVIVVRASLSSATTLGGAVVLNTIWSMEGPPA